MKSRQSAARGNRKRGPARIATVDLDVAVLAEPIGVTSLVQGTRNAGRARIAINGLDVGDLTLDYVADNSLHPGRELSRREAEELIAAAARTLVLDKALELLAVRSRSARDLRIRLRRAGADDAAITWAIERLTRQGYVDDGAYARQVARAKVVSGGVSRRTVMTVLRRRGIPADVADEAIDATLQDVDLDEEGAALEAARKRLRALESLDPAKRRQRLYAFLARRGYDSGVVRRVLAEVLR